MAEEEQTVTIDDAEEFRLAAAEEAPVERVRDEKGRFVAKEPEAPPAAPVVAETKAEEAPAQPVAQATPPKEEEGHVPSGRLREIREERDAALKRVEEFNRQTWELQSQVKALQEQFAKANQPKQEPVDFFANPEAAISQHLNPIQQQYERDMQEMRLMMSRTQAIALHGKDAVAEMEESINKLMMQNYPDIGQLAQRMRSSNDPAGVAMQWYKNHKLMEATGGDIDAYKNKVLEEALKDQAFVAKVIEGARAQAGAPTNPKNVINLPPSLNRVGSAGGVQSPDDGDMSDKSLFQYATKR